MCWLLLITFPRNLLSSFFKPQGSSFLRKFGTIYQATNCHFVEGCNLRIYSRTTYVTYEFGYGIVTCSTAVLGVEVHQRHILRGRRLQR